MTLQEQAKLLGPAYWFLGKGDPLTFRVVVKDVRVSFGRVDLLIAPEAGSGSRWVARESVEYVKLPA